VGRPVGGGAAVMSADWVAFVWMCRKKGWILFGQSSIREHVAVDDIIEKFKREVILQQYIPNRENRFGIQFYKPCIKSGYTYNISVYLGKQNWLTQMLRPHME
jgi:hypothetical protein